MYILGCIDLPTNEETVVGKSASACPDLDLGTQASISFIEAQGVLKIHLMDALSFVRHRVHIRFA